MKTAKEIHEIDPWKVKVFVSRDRDKDGFEALNATAEDEEQYKPGKVRDIRGWSKEKRMEDDRLCDWGLITGQGRLLSARKRGAKFRATIEDGKQERVLEDFMIENMNRERLPWAAKARLIAPEIAAGRSFDDIARELHIAPKHVMKMHRILQKTAPGLEGEVAEMSINDAEVLTALPKNAQLVVMEEVRELGGREIKALVKRAEKLMEESGDEELSPTAFKQSLERLNEDLQRMREKAKVVRPHHALGPMNLHLLLQDNKFRKACDAEGINYKTFLSVSK